MLNVLLIYYEPQPSGQTTHVLSLAQGLDRSRYNVTVVLPANLQHTVQAFRQTGATVVPLPLRKVVWSPSAVSTVTRRIRRQNIDIVHVHSQEAGLMARIVAWMAGARRIIYTPQTIDIRQTRWRWLYVLIERTLASVTDTIISVNEADRNRLIRWGIPPSKVVTIPNGIALDAFAEGSVDARDLRRTLGLDENRPVVMQVGRLSAQKNPLAFVEGAARVVRDRPDVQFALVGEGPLREAVAERIRTLDLDRRVRLLGWREAAFRLMPAADVVSLTSRWEGTPYTLLEAMAWSRPVVATAVNGCPEIVLDGITGLLAPPGDVEAWARCVVRLVSDPALSARMGQQGRRRMEACFSLPAMIECVEKVYVGDPEA